MIVRAAEFELAQNGLLSRLPERARGYLANHASVKRVLAGEILYDAMAPMHSAIFPLRGMVSLQNDSDDQRFREVLSIGTNGMVGAPGLFGTSFTGSRAVAAMPGVACWFPTPILQEVMDQQPDARQVFADYLGSVLRSMARSVVCCSSHAAYRRVANWIARASNLSGSTEIEITQHALGFLLNVRQATVSEACSVLQDRQAIAVSRGVIKVLSKPVLEGESCNCWRY